MAAPQIFVQAPGTSQADGSFPYALGGKQGEQIVTELHGKYYTQTLRGNVFHGSTTAAGSAIPIYTTLSSIFTLWNPSTLKNLVPLFFKVLWTSTTAALGGITYMYSSLVGTQTSTLTNGISAATTATPVNGLIGYGGVSVSRFCTAATLVTAASFLGASGISIGATTAATATLPMWIARDDFDGTVIIPPGAAMHVMASTAVLMVGTMSLAWMEVPV